MVTVKERAPLSGPSEKGAERALSERQEAKMIRVLIADDHPAIRAGLVGELAGAQDIQVVGQAEVRREL